MDITLALGILLTVVWQGCVGNAAYDAIEEVFDFEAFIRKIKMNRELNHYLASALSNSFLKAQIDVVNGVLNELINKSDSTGFLWMKTYHPKQHNQDIFALKNKLKALKKQLHKTRKSADIIPEESLEKIVYELTLTSVSKSSPPETLIDELLPFTEDCDVSNYKFILKERADYFFQKISEYFLKEITNHDQLYRFFSILSTAKNNADLKKELQDIQKWLTDINDAQKEIISLYKEFTEASSLISESIKIKEFQSIVEDKTSRFVGRENIFQIIDDLLKDPVFKSGYIVIRGVPGIGKSSLMAEMVKRWGAVHHFNSITMGIYSHEVFLENICAQLIVKYNLKYSKLPPNAKKDSGFLSQLLREVASKKQEQPILVFVDALDEARNIELPCETNILCLPPILPKGVFFVVTSRFKKNYPFYVNERRDILLSNKDEDNINDVRKYIFNYIQEYQTKMVFQIEKWGISKNEFIDTITKKSEGNFMYLFHVLNDIRDAKLNQSNLDSIHNLPQGLESYYQAHWEKMKEQDKEKFENYYKPVVCQLAVARIPVSIDQLAEWTQLEHWRIKEVIRDWREFLDEFFSEKYKDYLYRIYHTKFQEFLNKYVGLQPYDSIIVQTMKNKIK